MNRKLLLVLMLSILALLVLLPMVGGMAHAVQTMPVSTGAVPAQSGTPEPASPAGEVPMVDAAVPTLTALLEDVVPSRTPEPTATPGMLEEGVVALTEAAGLEEASALGLTAADWINLVLSLLMVLVGYLIGTWLIRSLLVRVVQRSATAFDDRFLASIGSDVRWLVVLITLHFATVRLTFVSVEVKAFLKDAYVVIGLLLTVRVIFKLIDLADEWARQRAIEVGREGELEPLMVLLSRVGRVLVVLLGITILLSYFGVNVMAFAALLGIGGLAISLAAQDTIADAIAGFIILVDQPFRIGDRIEIQGEGTWGDVVDIGLRTTRIRTRDNRLVIVPNSTISKNQVINYTFPDPRYRIQTHVGVAYGTDIESARKLLIDTVRHIEGVLPDKPVDALYVEMGDSAMVFRVRWWIESYEDTRGMFDRVHTALQQALDEAGIECPFPTQTLNLQVEQQALARVSPEAAEQDRRPAGS